MAQKPDRFERMVIKEWEKGAYLNWSAIARLLRRQHREMMRMVKNMPRVPYLVSDSLMRSEVIETLKRYAK